MDSVLEFVLVDGNQFSIANLTSFFCFTLTLCALVLIIHTFLNGRNYR